MLELAKFIVACLLCLANIVCPAEKCDEWQKRFCEGCTSLQDDSSPRQVHRAITPDVIARIDGLIREIRQITEEQIRVGISHGSVHAIINMQFRKICAQWVPHQLTGGQTIDRMAACLSNLQRYSPRQTLTSSTQPHSIPDPFERHTATFQKFVFYFAEFPLFLPFFLFSFLPSTRLEL